VHNRNYPIGSIAEGYLKDDSRYLNDNVQTKFNTPPRNLDGPIGNGVITTLKPFK